MQSHVLTISTSDSSGGSGIQADIKTIVAHGAHASSAITGLNAQNTRGIHGFFPVSPEFVIKQIETVVTDMKPDAIKIGFLGDNAMIDAISDVLENAELDLPSKIIVDPCMVERTGALLLDPESVANLKRRLLVKASVITPNRLEAEALTGMTIKDIDDMRHATDMMRTYGAEAVILKGGQLTGEKVVDLISWGGREEVIETEMLNYKHTHGAGCTLSSAVAVGMANGLDVMDAFKQSIAYLHKAIETAEDWGEGIGPVNHACGL